ncbi:MAG: glycoside hydrolase family 16 protein [Proteobacteria bacterium]|nr:glycoside hydrolase family 16 protein [Pseudomonadota bacterium]
MSRPSPSVSNFAVWLLLGALLSGCGGSGSSGDTDSPAPPPISVTPPPPTPPPEPINVNIDDPVLTVEFNEPITPGGTSTLVWSDEFDDERLDPRRWFFETGDGGQYSLAGWGNDELQWYLTDSALLENGRLVITARRESQNGYDYTSARLHTRSRFAFRYGRIEARLRLPGGQGLWPAFWLLPQEDTYGTWAASGEIDIMEAINLGGTGGNTVFGTLHYGGESPDNVFSGNEYVVPGSATDEFHLYALEWDPTEIRWYVDDVLYAMQNFWHTASADYPAPFDQPFYILLNVAVGGRFPGAPSPGTVFPVTMEVDYVRVYSGAN